VEAVRFSVDHFFMVIDMNESQVSSIDQMRAVLAGTQALEFHICDDDAHRYRWIASVLERIAYRQRKRPERGVVLAYLRRFSGYSRAQITRLVGRWLERRPLEKRYGAPAQAFARRYSLQDIELLAQIDQAMDTLSGPATVHVLRRQYQLFGDDRFERLAVLSVSHLYNLRARPEYLGRRVHFEKTRPNKNITIGVRRAPQPDGRAGFIRIDSVHQGDRDGIKGLYHINAVDCVTQWQVVATVQGISEAFLLPVIEQMLEQFPFRIHGFHADNGSEYVNHTVARMLEKLRIEFTRSRPRRSNDNALAETKNGAVVRKAFGYSHIPQEHATVFNEFCRTRLNPFLNLHRPCLFATEVEDAKKPGRIRKVYRHDKAMTPLEKLASLPAEKVDWKPGESLDKWQAMARSVPPLDAGQAVQDARKKLFESLRRRAA
jgi:transposase InsO family protein